MFYSRFLLLLTVAIGIQSTGAQGINQQTLVEDFKQAQGLGLQSNESGIKTQKDIKKEAATSLVLKPSSLLDEKNSANDHRPTFIQADSMVALPNEKTQLEGNVSLRRVDTFIRAEHLTYFKNTDQIHAQDNVLVNKAGNLFRGTLLDLQVDSFEGVFIATGYTLSKSNAYGKAQKVQFIDDKRTLINKATYTTCRPQDSVNKERNWSPPWLLKAESLMIDTQTGEGLARGSEFVMNDFASVPLPPFSFPLTKERKSGLLPPTVGLDTISGIQYSQPYYWDIAPNRDATITPTYRSKRGTDIGSEFRYLEGKNGSDRGQIYYDFMNNDNLRDANRWALSQQHAGSASFADSGMGQLNYSLNMNRVSDNYYWQDFTNAPGLLTQQLLPTDVNVNWGVQNVTTTVRSLKWQTLQSNITPITPPYDRLPEINSKLNLKVLGGFNLNFEGDYTEFRSDRSYSCLLSTIDCQPNAKRVYGLSQITYPMESYYGYLTPKFLIHSRSYDFDSPTNTGLMTASVTVPTFSLDGLLKFQRSLDLFGNNWIQTLEPRAFFVYTPYRDQNSLPVYDSAKYDFNFASIFLENAFSGNDRISDSKVLTLGGSSQLIDAQSGFEVARIGAAQRIQLRDQDIYLPSNPVPSTGRFSDFLVGGSLNLNERWKMGSIYEYNPQTSQSDLSSLDITHSPSNYRLINFEYRYDRLLSADMIGAGWQWPINDLWGDRGKDLGPGRGLGEDRWYTLGRINYNKDTGQIGDLIIGIEYDAGCWLGRLVLEKLQITSATANQSIMLQIEIDGVSRAGSNPLSALRNYLPRYQNLRNPLADPSRYVNYQ
jgi:LPS-assembly protein